MGSKVEFPVFTETNLGTRITISVSSEITAEGFKGVFEKAHVGCFPEIGFLAVDAVLVKRNCYFYHLPDLLPLELVFQDFQGPWVLHVNATLSKNLSDINNVTEVRQKRRRKKKPKVKKPPENISCEILEQESFEPRRIFSCVNERGGNGLQESLEARGNVSCVNGEVKQESVLPKRKFSRVNEVEGNSQQESLHSSKVSGSNATIESPCSSSVSVSDIINRYFKDCVNLDHIESASSTEVTPRNVHCDGENLSLKMCSKKQSSVRARQRSLPSLLPVESNAITPKNRYETSEVVESLVVASNNLGSSQKFSLSKCKLRDADSWSKVRGRLVFEIDSNE